MDIKQIQELIKLINKSNIGEVRIEEKDFKITLRSKDYANKLAALPTSSNTSNTAPPQPTLPSLSSPEPVKTEPEPTASEEPAAEVPADADGYHTIKSPMIGTFYRSSSPDKDAFVKVGDTITPGKAICIIEAMKLFNEIESEVTGKIVKVLVEDASPVEYDQPLFLVEAN